MKTNTAKVTLLGIPFDGQSSYLRGTAEAPGKIRAAMSCDASNKWTESGVDLGLAGSFEDSGDLLFSAKSRSGITTGDSRGTFDGYPIFEEI